MDVLGEMNKDVIKKVIKLLAMVILLETMVIWIMMPTPTYKKLWLTPMRAKLGKSIYFWQPGSFTSISLQVIIDLI